MAVRSNVMPPVHDRTKMNMFKMAPVAALLGAVLNLTAGANPAMAQMPGQMPSAAARSARNAGHGDRGVKQQTLPEALEWLWHDYQLVEQ